MAKLYLVAIDHDSIDLKPTFQKVPPGLRIGAMEVLDLDDAREMDDMAWRGVMDGLVKVLAGTREKAKADSAPLATPEPPPAAPELPLDQQGDPDAWRSEMEDKLPWE